MLKEGKNTIALLTDYAFGELNLHRLWVEIYDTIPKNNNNFKCKPKFQSI